MDGDPRVRQLLEKLLDSEHTPEEVCRHCPELLPQVRDRWQRKRACEAQLDALFPAPESNSPSRNSSLMPFSADPPRIPGYEVQEVLGRGGMGVVYRALHVRLNRSVALKMLLTGAHASRESRERFLREAKVVAGLRHPNIVQVHDMGDHDGQPYFTMEFVEGGNLAQKLAGTPQPSRQVATLVATLAEAVEAAHQSGIVHRDLKPANILTADGTPKISDFGLARRLDGEAGLTLTGTTVGTPSYMAPEQAEARPLTCGTAVDIYALGAILYELLTGRPPLRAETAAETVRQVISQDPVPPSQLNGKVPRDLETICLKCLHKEPHLRYAGAAALAADLRRFLGGEAIAARPDGRLAWPARWVRRRPVISAAVAVGTLFTVALLGGGLWLISDRAAATRRVEAVRAATERDAGEDLRDMARWLEKSSWPEARAALERAKGRLDNRGSAELVRLLDQGDRELELVDRLEEIRLDVARAVLGHLVARTAEQYEEAFRGAGIGQVDDAPEMVAERVRASNIPNALVAALDHWSAFTKDPRHKNWVLAVARKADRDPTGWRDRARDPVVRAHEEALVEVIRTTPVADQSVPLFLALDKQLNPGSKERLPFLNRIQQAHPGDYWVNLTLGDVLMREGQVKEAIRYYQAAVSIRPRMPLGYEKLADALSLAGRKKEAVGPFLQAVNLEPTGVFSYMGLAQVLGDLGRQDDAIDRLRMAIGFSPNASILYAVLGHYLAEKGRLLEALIQERKAAALAPENPLRQQVVRSLLARLGRGDETRVAWQTALEAKPSRHGDWYGYAEFCLLLGQEDEYRRARQALLATFGTSTDPIVAQRTALACLLRPAPEDELRQAAALAELAVGVQPSDYPRVEPLFPFVKGLAEYRQGRFDRAISTMRGDASKVGGPGPGLVLAMALHRSGQSAEARKSLAKAVLYYDWRPQIVTIQDAWLRHVLRREAERMIVPGLPAFLAGKYQPRDNDERLALLGVCQFTNRTHALSRLYADAFAVDPQIANDLVAGNRYDAARAASLAGRGQGEDAGSLGQEEQARWRMQALAWLKLDLAAWSRKMESSREWDRIVVGLRLTRWLADPDLSGLREPGAMKMLSAEERDEWLALWKEVDAVIKRATGA